MGPESGDERNADAGARMSAAADPNTTASNLYDNGHFTGDRADFAAAVAARRPGVDDVQRTVTAPVISSSLSPATEASASLFRSSPIAANYTSSTRHTHALYTSTSSSTTGSNSYSRSQHYRSAPPLPASNSDAALEAFLNNNNNSSNSTAGGLGGGGSFSFASGHDSPGRRSVVTFSEPMETPGAERRRRLQEESQRQQIANGQQERGYYGDVSSSADETMGILGADRNGVGVRAYRTTTMAGESALGKRKQAEEEQKQQQDEAKTDEMDAESRYTDETAKTAKRVDARVRSNRVRESSVSSYASTVRSRRQDIGGGGSMSRNGRAGDTDSASGAGNNASSNGNGAVIDGGGEEGWWKRMAERYGSVELDNKGSVARDHLALERTFLAWLRTSLSFASIGIAVTQLFRLNTSLPSPANSSDVHLRHMGKPLGATFIGVSIVILLIGFHRYFESQHYVIRGKFPASRGSVVMVSVIAAALIVTSLVVILAVAPQAIER